MLDDLVAVIETIKYRIEKYAPTLSAYEARTRVALIDPLLTALGWNVSDPSVVTPEYRVDVGWADYMLLGAGGKPAAVIEAKKLGTFVENHLSQAFGYCIEQGIAYAAVTDGNRWQLYRTFDQVPMEQKRILDISIANAQPHECALTLLLLWQPNLATGKAVAANEPVFVQPSDLTTDDKSSSGPTPEPVPSGIWIPLARVQPGKNQQPPKAIRFSAGQSRQIPSWRQVLAEVTAELASDGTLSAEDCPIRGLGFVNSSPGGIGGGTSGSWKLNQSQGEIRRRIG